MSVADNTQPASWPGQTQIVEGEVIEGHLDAGFADEEMAYSEDVNQEAQELTDENLPMPLVDAIPLVLFHPGIPPNTKVLLMALVWLGKPATGEALAAGSGLTVMQVHYALKRMIKLGVVTEADRPDYDLKRFVRTYEVTDQQRGGIASAVTTDQADG